MGKFDIAELALALAWLLARPFEAFEPDVEFANVVEFRNAVMLGMVMVIHTLLAAVKSR